MLISIDRCFLEGFLEAIENRKSGYGISEIGYGNQKNKPEIETQGIKIARFEMLRVK